jgi:hypothetical protein
MYNHNAASCVHIIQQKARSFRTIHSEAFTLSYIGSAEGLEEGQARTAIEINGTAALTKKLNKFYISIQP